MKIGVTDRFAAHRNSNDYTERAPIAIARRSAPRFLVLSETMQLVVSDGHQKRVFPKVPKTAGMEKR